RRTGRSQLPTLFLLLDVLFNVLSPGHVLGYFLPVTLLFCLILCACEAKPRGSVPSTPRPPGHRHLPGDGAGDEDWERDGDGDGDRDSDGTGTFDHLQQQVDALLVAHQRLLKTRRQVQLHRPLHRLRTSPLQRRGAIAPRPRHGDREGTGTGTGCRGNGNRGGGAACASALSFPRLGTRARRWRCPAGELRHEMAAGRGALGMGAVWKVLGKRAEGVAPAVWARQMFTRSRIPKAVFQPRPGDHEKYGGDPEQPHKIHVVTRIKSVIGRPYWEKMIMHNLGLDKAHQPRLHKNIPSVNSKLKVVKHLIRIQPLKLPHGLPTEEEMSDTFLTSKGELIIRSRLKPVEQKEIKS
uniref:Large ribosomal subunit protein uL30m n=1 Tax=Anas zonorhyncha TaxID=75864 RepID=A0A8B9VUB6_9AVES